MKSTFSLKVNEIQLKKMEGTSTCCICDRFDDVSVSVTSLEEEAKYLLSLFTETEVSFLSFEFHCLTF